MIDVDAAVAAVLALFTRWRTTPEPERTRIRRAIVGAEPPATVPSVMPSIDWTPDKLRRVDVELSIDAVSRAEILQTYGNEFGALVRGIFILSGQEITEGKWLE